MGPFARRRANRVKTARDPLGNSAFHERPSVSVHPDAPSQRRQARPPPEEAILYAYEHALNSRPLDDEDDPRRWLVVGIDQSGRVLELVVLVFDGGGELLIHAMKARPQFLDELA